MNRRWVGVRDKEQDFQHSRLECPCPAPNLKVCQGYGTGDGSYHRLGCQCRLDAGDDPHNPLMLGGAELQCAENCSKD